MANMEDRDPSYWKDMNEGAAPPPKIIWQNWSDEQKAASGFDTFDKWKAAAQKYRGRYDVSQGGDIGLKHQKQEFDLASMLGFDANREQFIEAMNRIGLFDQHEQGKARYNQLLGAFDGNYVPGGGYHWGPGDSIIDVSTSDENVRGKALPNNGRFTRQSGLANALPQATSARNMFKNWTSIHGGERDANGNFFDADTGQAFDDFGNPLGADGKMTGYGSFFAPQNGQVYNKANAINSANTNGQVSGTPFNFSNFLQTIQGLTSQAKQPAERTQLKKADPKAMGGWASQYGGFWNPNQKVGSSPLQNAKPSGIQDPFTTTQTNANLNSTWGIA